MPLTLGGALWKLGLSSTNQIHWCRPMPEKA
jgi:hypothetical protein